MEVINCEQGTTEWFEARRGKVTGSKFGTVMASGRGGSESSTRKKYMQQLVAERISGIPTESYSNGHMERGHEWEPLAIEEYEFINEVECEAVGFICDEDKGASPDRLVGNDGLVEVKTRTGQLQIELLLSGEVPKTHIPQIQGQLWISEREWCDFVCYSKGLKTFTKKVFRDDNYINKTLWPSVDKFINEMKELEEKIRNV